MKSSTWAVLLLVVGFAGAMFWLGRRSIPDRTAELIAWRQAADSTLQASLVKAAADRARDSSRIAEADARYERERQRVAGASARAARSEAATDSLKSLLTVVQASADSAGIIQIQALVIARQDTTIQVLGAGLEDAQAAMERLLEDRRRADAAREVAVQEAARLRALLGAGLEVTKPSRGGPLGYLDCTIGVGATRQGLDTRSATCGVSIRALLGGRL